MSGPTRQATILGFARLKTLFISKLIYRFVDGQEAGKYVCAEVRIDLFQQFQFDLSAEHPKIPGRTLRVFLSPSRGENGAFEIAAVEDLGKFARPSKSAVQVSLLPPGVVPPELFKFPQSGNPQTTEFAKKEILRKLQMHYGITAEWPSDEKGQARF
jgi:hypothetical protein